MGTTPYCDVEDGELLAHQEGALRGGRAEWVAAHVRACAHCRRRLAAFLEADRLLADWVAGLPDTDDPAGRARLRAFAEAELARRARWWPLHRWLRPLRRFPPPWPGRVWAALGLKAALLAALAALLLRPDLAPAGATVARLLLALAALVVLVTAAIVAQLAALYAGAVSSALPADPGAGGPGVRHAGRGVAGAARRGRDTADGAR
jgi:hypothetical protein